MKESEHNSEDNFDLEKFLSSPPLKEDFDFSAATFSDRCDQNERCHDAQDNSVSYVAFASLFELLCNLTEPDQEKRKHLLACIAQTLIRLKLIPPLCFSECLAPARQKFQAAVAKLLRKASVHVNDLAVSTSKSVKQTENLQNSPKTACPSFYLAKDSEDNREITLLHSPYYNDYEEISRLGKGGFGEVFEVRSYVDGQTYAVKKISFDLTRSDLCIKTLREVKILARLNHPNIVRYYGAWLEFAPFALNDRQAYGHRRHSSRCRIAEVKTFSEESVTNQGISTSLRVSNSSPSIVFQDDEMHARNNAVRIDNSQVSSSVPAAGGLTDSLVLWKDRWRKKSFSQEDLRYSGLFNNDWNDSGSCSSSEDTNCHRSAYEDYYRGKVRKHWPLARSLVLYVKMELGSQTLRQWISYRNERIPVASESVFDHVDSRRNELIIKQLLEGLDYIHQLGVQHRDVKPSNILIRLPDHRVLLGDFGLACLTDTSHNKKLPEEILYEQKPGDIDDSSCKVVQNYSGTLKKPHKSTGVGTLSYSAPEQLKSHYYNHKADLYSVGVIMLELYYPFRTYMERMQRFIELKSGNFCAEMEARWPVESLLIKSLVQHNPAARPSAKEVLESYLFRSANDIVRTLKMQLKELYEKNQKLRLENEACRVAVDKLV